MLWEMCKFNNVAEHLVELIVTKHVNSELCKTIATMEPIIFVYLRLILTLIQPMKMRI